MPTYNIPERQFYKDLPISFNAHPQTGDVRPLVNDEAVKRALKNLLFTNRGERFFNYRFGTDIRKILFEPISPGTTVALREIIEEAIRQYEPRVALVDVSIEPNEDQNLVDVVIIFQIANVIDPVTLEVTLERIR